MRAHEGDLGKILTSDVRGKKITEFVGLLGQALASERAAGGPDEVAVGVMTLDAMRERIRARVGGKP